MSFDWTCPFVIYKLVDMLWRMSQTGLTEERLYLIWFVEWRLPDKKHRESHGSLQSYIIVLYDEKKKENGYYLGRWNHCIASTYGEYGCKYRKDFQETIKKLREYTENIKNQQDASLSRSLIPEITDVFRYRTNLRHWEQRRTQKIFVIMYFPGMRRHSIKDVI